MTSPASASISTPAPRKQRPSGPDLLGRSRLSVYLRLLLVLAGGYGLSALTAASLSLALPLSPADAVLTATMLSFPVFVAVTIWTFHVNNMRRVLIGLAIPALLLTLPLLMLQNGG